MLALTQGFRCAKHCPRRSTRKATAPAKIAIVTGLATATRCVAFVEKSRRIGSPSAKSCLQCTLLGLRGSQPLLVARDKIGQPHPQQRCERRIAGHSLRIRSLARAIFHAA